MTSAVRLLLAVAVVLGLCAMQAPTLTYDPRHYQNDDPIWTLLNKTQVTPDKARGVYVASFPAALQSQAGGPLTLAGFILPLQASPVSRHFMLVRRNSGCPFCPPNAPTEALEIMADTPVAYTGEEVKITGRLKLIASSGDGLFFRLENAALAR